MRRVLSAGATLLAIACGAETPPAAPAAKPHGGWLADVTESLGLDARYDTLATGEMHMPEIMGGGVALLDHDGDGDLDAYVASGGANRLFRNDDGRFVDATAESGLGDEGYGMGIAVADYDNDGDVDVYLTNFGPDKMYRNEGGRFVDASDVAAALPTDWSASAVWCDYDLDGLLDVYVTRYVAYDPGKKCNDAAGRPTYCGPLEFPPVPDVLLHNEGGGRLRDVSHEAGIDTVRAAGLGVVCDDFDDDGRPDFYVANDAYGNQLWINGGDGRFTDRAVLAGAAFNVHGQAEAGMGVVAADFDDDRRVDLFVTHLSLETNTYYANLGGSRGFTDSTGQAGLGETSMALTGFGTVAFDVELDGDLDLAVVNGRVNRTDPRPDASVPEPWSWFAEPNLFYRNEGGGRFHSVEDETAQFVRPVEVSRGLAAGDWDGDGDEDLLLGNIESPARLYRNEAGRAGNWLAVRAVDPALGGRDAIGAHLEVEIDGRVLSRTVTRGTGYLSSGDAVRHFGVGSAERVDVIVQWPGGGRERFAALEAGRRVVLRRGDGESP